VASTDHQSWGSSHLDLALGGLINIRTKSTVWRKDKCKDWYHAGLVCDSTSKQQHVDNFCVTFTTRPNQRCCAVLNNHTLDFMHHTQQYNNELIISSWSRDRQAGTRTISRSGFSCGPPGSTGQPPTLYQSRLQDQRLADNITGMVHWRWAGKQLRCYANPPN